MASAQPRMMEMLVACAQEFAVHRAIKMTPYRMATLLSHLERACADRTFKFPSEMVVRFAELAEFMADQMMKQDALERMSQ